MSDRTITHNVHRSTTAACTIYTPFGAPVAAAAAATVLEVRTVFINRPVVKSRDRFGEMLRPTETRRKRATSRRPPR